jgi:predicted Zn finger-like uncharacterized protein
MRLVCPECSATYEVSDSLFAQSREVRCNRCGFQWSVVAATAEAGAMPAAAVPSHGTIGVAPVSVSPPVSAPAEPVSQIRDTDGVSAAVSSPAAPPDDVATGSVVPVLDEPAPLPRAAIPPSTRRLFVEAQDDGQPRGPDAEERLLSAELDYRSPHRRGGGWVSMVLVLAVIVAAVAAIILCEKQIVAAYPPAAAYYADLGL